MSWTISKYLFEAVDAALRAEPQALREDPREVALVLITIGIRVATLAKFPGGALPLLAGSLPSVQPDEKKALAAVREAYAASRRAKKREAAGRN